MDKVEYDPKFTVLQEASMGRDKRGERREGCVIVDPYALFHPLQSGSFNSIEIALGEATNCLKTEASRSLSYGPNGRI